MLGCYLLCKDFTVICLSNGLSNTEILTAVLIHEMGHALHFIHGSSHEYSHGKAWLRHTKNLFNAAIMRTDVLTNICHAEIILKNQTKLIFTATKM